MSQYITEIYNSLQNACKSTEKIASCADQKVADDQTRRIQCDILLFRHVRQKARVSGSYDRGSYVMSCSYVYKAHVQEAMQADVSHYELYLCILVSYSGRDWRHAATNIDPPSNDISQSPYSPCRL
jgi:hypothetical protein